MLLAIGIRFTTMPSLITLLALVVLMSVPGACTRDSSTAAARDVVFAVTIVSSLTDPRFTGDSDIFSIDKNAEDILQLTAAEGKDFSPAWSPKKGAIAFISERNGYPALWIMDIDGKSKEHISPPDKIVTNFKWAPDSNRIAVEIQEDESYWFGLIDLQLNTFSPRKSQNQNVKIGGWSPDGEWIVFFSVEKGNQGIRRSNPNGVDDIAVSTGPDSNPQYSPDGRSIAFNRLGETGAMNLVITDINGGNVVNLAPDILNKTQFEWAPDSKRIVFVGESPGNAEIYTVEPDGDHLSKLTSNRLTDAAPHWSRNGKSILFLSESAGTFSLYTMGRDGDNQKKINLAPDAVLESDW